MDQVNSGQRDEIRKSQMEQSRENIPEQMYIPQKPIIPLHPNQNTQTPHQNYQKRVTQNDRQADLELDFRNK